jgi:class 3 adenylate cyclase/tetratricopeptide (TPR) repeat protein
VDTTQLHSGVIDKQASARAEAPPIALVFTDMVGSSAAKRAASLGGNATERDSAFLDSIQSRHLHLIRECVAAHNGKEIMTIGDSFFLTFEDPRSAILCSAEIQMRLKAQPIMTANGRMQIRIGIHIGTPKYFENSWHGTDVDTAARAESAGSPDQIVVTDAFRKAVPEMEGVRFRPLGTFSLKGVGDVKLWDADYDAHGPRKPRLTSVEDIRRAKWTKLAKNAAVVLLAGALGIGIYYSVRPHPKTRITDKDQIIVADFDNKTGDPVFDSTLKEALDIQLEQSPYLQLVNDQELHGDLRYLGQPADQKITPALAREIGQREGIKAYLASSVASLGNSYVVSIDAVNCATGEVFAREQAEASDKPHVLTAVATAATNLRATLGESLASIQKLTTPYMDVTTSSLEAFHAFSLGEDEHEKGRDLPEAESFYQQAVELDPGFAMAYARLGTVYSNNGSNTKGIAYLEKAMALRQRVTERERIYIESQLAVQQQNLPKSLEIFKLYTTTYPRDSAAWNNFGIVYQYLGNFEQAASAFERSYEIAKWDVIGATNAAGTLLEIDNISEAKHYLNEARVEGGMEDINSISMMMLYDFQTGNPDWRREIAQAAERQDGFILDQLASNASLSRGDMAEAVADAERGAQRAVTAKLPDTAGNILATLAMNDVQLGDCQHARTLSHRALALDHSIETVPNAALALAFCGEGATALAEAEKLARSNPDNTLATQVFLPEVKAAAALTSHHPEQVKALLTAAEPYGDASFTPYVEGVAYLAQKQPSEAISALAAARRWSGTSLQVGANGCLQVPLYSSALLLTARAQAMQGDKASAIKTYQQLLNEWKTADPGFKPREEAQHELAGLQANATAP